MDRDTLLETLIGAAPFMKNKAKTPKVPGFMRTILAANVRGLMEHQYRSASNKPKGLAADAGVSLSTVQRIIAGEVGATIDNIELIAAALGVSGYQLLMPNLRPDNPQVVVGATKDEERLYARWRRDRVAMRD